MGTNIVLYLKCLAHTSLLLDHISAVEKKSYKRKERYSILERRKDLPIRLLGFLTVI